MSAIVKHTIDGREYTLTKISIIEAGRIGAKIGSELLPALASAGISGDISKASASMTDALKNLDVERFYDDALKCLKNGCFVNGYNLSEHHYFEKHFSEYPQDLFPALLWALKENVGGFFGQAASSRGSTEGEA